MTGEDRARSNVTLANRLEDVYADTIKRIAITLECAKGRSGTPGRDAHRSAGLDASEKHRDAHRSAGLDASEKHRESHRSAGLDASEKHRGAHRPAGLDASEKHRESRRSSGCDASEKHRESHRSAGLDASEKHRESYRSAGLDASEKKCHTGRFVTESPEPPTRGQTSVRAPVCHCGVEAPMKTARSGENNGKQYVSCYKERYHATRCRFFKWL